MIMRLTSAVSVALAGVVVLSGCQAAEPDSAVAPSSPTEESQTETGGEIQLDADLWPLTGSALNGGTASAPALAAKIDNHPLARPQVGLDAADIVFRLTEYNADGRAEQARVESVFRGPEP